MPTMRSRASTSHVRGSTRPRGDRARAAAAAELARHACGRTRNARPPRCSSRARRLRERVVAVALGQPVEHHRRRQDRRGRDWRCPGRRCRAPCRGRLEQRVRSPMSADGAMPMPPTSAARQVGQDVAEHVLGDQHVEVPGLPHQVERHRIDVVVVGRDVREDARRARRRSCGRRPSSANTLALSTQVTRPGRPRALRRCGEAEREVAHALACRARVISIVSRASRSSSTTPLPRAANRPSVDSRTSTRSMSRARGSASGSGSPGSARIGRTPA